MPKSISWLPRLTEIRRSVDGSTREQYDRSAIERLFQVQSSSAGKLMALMRRVRSSSKVYFVDRNELLTFIENFSKADDPSALLERMRSEKPRPRRTVRCKLRDDGFIEPVRPLPTGVAYSFSRGKLEISFRTAEEFMHALLAASMTLVDDEAGFVRDFCFEAEDQLRKQTIREGIQQWMAGELARAEDEAEAAGIWPRKPPTSVTTAEAVREADKAAAAS